MKLLVNKLEQNPEDQDWMEFLKSRQFIHEASKKTNHTLLVLSIRDCLAKAGRIVCLEQRKFEIISLLPRMEFFRDNENFQKLQECLNIHLNIMDSELLNVILTNETASCNFS